MPGSVMNQEVNSSRSNFCSAMYPYKRQKNTWGASNDCERR